MVKRFVLLMEIYSCSDCFQACVFCLVFDEFNQPIDKSMVCVGIGNISLHFLLFLLSEVRHQIQDPDDLLAA